MSTPYRKPQGEPPQQVRVRIAVIIDVEGNYSAFGGTRYDDTDAIQIARDELDNHSTEHNRHIKFLEITLEGPSTLPVNLEAQIKNEIPPAIKVT